MSSRFAVQCVVLMLAVPLSACGGTAPGPSAPAAAAARSAPHAQGRLRASEYAQLRRALRPAGRCADMTRHTHLLAAVRRECRTAMQMAGALSRFVPSMQGCAAQRSPNCAERVFDGMGARFEALVRVGHGVHVALVERRLPAACRRAIQGSPSAFASLRGLGVSARELSADVDASDLNGYLSSAQRFVAAARRFVKATTGPDRSPRRLRRCPRA